MMIWFARFCLSTLALFWVSALVRAIRSRIDVRYRADQDTEPPLGSLSVGVVVPARNEARNVGEVVDTVLAQDHMDVRLVVLNDGSTDGTGDILAARKDPRLTIIDGGDAPLPDGWLGKAWACQRGAESLLERENPPDWLLFVDADVSLHPHAVAGALSHAQRNGLAMVSGLGRLVMESFWEKVLQPVVAGLIMAGNDLEKINHPDNDDDRPLANGQFILVRSDAYQAVGGHRAVRSDVLDDVGMASAITGAGYPYHLIFMRDLFSCRMYTNLGELWEGWTKNMYAGMRYSMLNLVVVMGFVFWIALSPYVLAAWGLYSGQTEWIAWGGGTAVLIQVVRLWLDIQVGQDLRYGPTQPLAVVMLLVLLAHSGLRAKRGTAAWKGRTVPIIKYASQDVDLGSDST
jgi:glycosyltransferase involved in cell wall biosynthesis